jgi:hypothetical protein
MGLFFFELENQKSPTLYHRFEKISLIFEVRLQTQVLVLL